MLASSEMSNEEEASERNRQEQVDELEGVEEQPVRSCGLCSGLETKKDSRGNPPYSRMDCTVQTLLASGRGASGPTWADWADLDDFDQRS
jgi:hypothetical protein